MRNGQVTQFSMTAEARVKPSSSSTRPKWAGMGVGGLPLVDFRLLELGRAGQGRAAALAVSNSRVPSDDSLSFPHSRLPESSHGTTLFLLCKACKEATMAALKRAHSHPHSQRAQVI